MKLDEHGPVKIPRDAHLELDGLTLSTTAANGWMVGCGGGLIVNALFMSSFGPVIVFSNSSLMFVAIMIMLLMCVASLALMSMAFGFWLRPLQTKLEVRGNRAAITSHSLGVPMRRRQAFSLSEATLSVVMVHHPKFPGRQWGQLRFEADRVYSFELNDTTEAHARWCLIEINKHLATLRVGETVSAKAQAAIEQLTEAAT